MGRGLGTGLVALVLLTACSGGSGSAAKTTTTSTTTSTTVATTSTTSPDDAVKAAYLAYWTMIERVEVAPDPDDPELTQRAVDPLLSQIRSDFATRKLQGRTTRLPDDPSTYSHRVSGLSANGDAATLEDCFVDGRVATQANGSVNDAVVTKRMSVTLVLSTSEWKVSDIQIAEQSDGVSLCAA